METDRYCLVCGYDALEKDGEKIDNFYLCSVCLTHYGIDTFEENVLISRRNEWISNGCCCSIEPWDLKVCLDQLENLRRIEMEIGYIQEHHIHSHNPDWHPDFDRKLVIKNFKGKCE